jgi:hypothetical protein
MIRFWSGHPGWWTECGTTARFVECREFLEGLLSALCGFDYNTRTGGSDQEPQWLPNRRRIPDPELLTKDRPFALKLSKCECREAQNREAENTRFRNRSDTEAYVGAEVGGAKHIELSNLR